MDPEPVQQASAYFFVPVAVAYLLACALWFAAVRVRPQIWPAPATLESHRPILDFGLVFAVAAGVFLLGQIYRMGYLLPTEDEGALGILFWNLDNVIIYSPIAIALVARKQSPKTVFLSLEKIHYKFILGFLIGVLSVLAFVAIRGEWSRIPDIAARSVSADALENAFPVFMEGVAVAYAFVRLRWLIGLWPAIAIPAVLFAVSHIPGSIEAGRTFGYILSFCIFNASLTCAILYTVQRSQDVIWIGVVHYLMDVAIEAF